VTEFSETIRFGGERRCFVSISDLVRSVPAGVRTQSAGLLRLNPFLFVFLYAGVSASWLILTRPYNMWLNWYVTIMWSLYLPAALLGFARIITKGDDVVSRSTFNGTTGKKVVFVIPTICRYDTLPALKRVLRSIEYFAPRNVANWRLDIVIEEHAEAGDELRAFIGQLEKVRLVVVPRNYSTPQGAKYKGRANHYATCVRRKDGEANAETFVYHLDDDTAIGEDTIASIAEFIEEKSGRYLLGQGILTFPHELSPSLFCRLADSIRPIDDVTRCALYTNDLGMPIGGMHGEHLLIRADIEDEIGWDFPTLVEDAYFGLIFATRYAGRARALRSFSYGASPASVHDLVRQRSRWAAGLFPLVFGKSSVPLRCRLPLMYALVLWMTGPLSHVGFVFVVSLLCGSHNTSPTVLSGTFPWTFCLAYSLWQYMEGLKMNAAVSSVRIRRAALMCALVPLIFIFSLVEGWACWRGIFKYCVSEPAFEVIRKET
jgi:egghead protein (zeste-white 4 protein)